MRLWLRTLRIHWAGSLPRQGVFCLWHRDLPACMAAFRNKGIHVLISQSRDGGFATHIAETQGYVVHRGSSSKGQEALRHLLPALRKGKSVGMALDGPKGPADVEKPGAKWLHAQSGVPMFRIEVRYGCHLKVRSWDRTRIPIPFSRVTIFVE